MCRWVCGLVAGLVQIGSFGCSPPAWSASAEIYDFKVFLGEKEIGGQQVTVSSDGSRARIHIDARFTVKFLAIPVYRYRHTNDEMWEGACLQEIRAETDDNGDSFFVRGSSKNGRMVVETHRGHWSGEGCIKTFAYWNVDWLTGGRLLNSQTGEVQRADVRTIGEETIAVRGVPTRAMHRRIVTDTFWIDLWHDLDGKWVALQSPTAKGDVLRYVLR